MERGRTVVDFDGAAVVVDGDAVVDGVAVVVDGVAVVIDSALVVVDCVVILGNGVIEVMSRYGRLLLCPALCQGNYPVVINE